MIETITGNLADFLLDTYINLLLLVLTVKLFSSCAETM